MNALHRETRAFARYLSGRDPTPYVIECYRRALAGAAVADDVAAPIDRILLASGRLGGLALRSADGYSRLIRPTGPLRRRLTLMLAILENAPDTHADLNAATLGTPASVLLRFAVAAGVSAATLLLALIGFGLVHLVSSPFGRRAGVAPG